MLARSDYKGLANFLADTASKQNRGTMRLRDLVGSAIAGLWRQKARTSLTLLGVSLGACAMIFSLGLGLGLRAFIDNEFLGRDEFWSIVVFPKNYGQVKQAEAKIPPERIAVQGSMNAERRQRIRKRLIDKYHLENILNERKLVAPSDIAMLKQFPDVLEVRSHDTFRAQFIRDDRQTRGELFAGASVGIKPTLESRLIAGRMPASPDANEMVVSEFCLYELGIRDDAELEACLGTNLQFVLGKPENDSGLSLAKLLTKSQSDLNTELSRTQTQTMEKIVQQLPKHIDAFELSALEKAGVKLMLQESKKPETGKKSKLDQSALGDLKIVGIVRELTQEEIKDEFLPTQIRTNKTSAFIPPETSARILKDTPDLGGKGFPSVIVVVRPGGDLPGIVQAVEGANLECYSSLKWYRNVKREVTLIAAGLNLFAFISLLVAALGITNTLFTSVLERTREIGIWKSLGARDGQILVLFLTEGAVIGFVGGVLGLLAGWLLSIPADGLVQSLIHEQSEDKLRGGAVFSFPLWVIFGTIAFSVIITTLAALYPARRAARVQPVEALRHE